MAAPAFLRLIHEEVLHYDWVGHVRLYGRDSSGSVCHTGSKEKGRREETSGESPVASLGGGTGAVHALAVLATGNLASGSGDNTVRVWDPATCAEIVRLEVDAPVHCLAALPNGRLVAGDSRGQLHLLEVLL